VLLKPGWEKNYYGNPPIYDIACLGQIMRVETFSDGRFNILLYGLSRVNMMEIKQEYPYRTAKVRLLRENPLSPRKESHLRREIWNTLSQILEPPPWGFSVMSAPHLDVGFLTDMIAYAFPFALNIKQELLESVDIETRVGKLLQALEGNEGKGKRVRIRELPFLYELARN
jgi:Lon protease-like protein